MSGPPNERDDEAAGSSDLWGEPGASGPESSEAGTGRDDESAVGRGPAAPDAERFPGEDDAGAAGPQPHLPPGPQVPPTPDPSVGPEVPSAPYMPPPASAPGPGGAAEGTPAAEAPRLERSRRDRWIGGVLGGFAAYFGVDATLVRIVVIVLLFATGFVPVAVAYVIALVVMPEAKPGAEPSPRPRPPSDGVPRLVLGAVLVAVGGLMLLNTVLPGWIRGDILAPLALIAIGVAVVVAGARR